MNWAAKCGAPTAAYKTCWWGLYPSIKLRGRKEHSPVKGTGRFSGHWLNAEALESENVYEREKEGAKARETRQKTITHWPLGKHSCFKYLTIYFSKALSLHLDHYSDIVCGFMSLCSGCMDLGTLCFIPTIGIPWGLVLTSGWGRPCVVCVLGCV